MSPDEPAATAEPVFAPPVADRTAPAPRMAEPTLEPDAGRAEPSFYDLPERKPVPAPVKAYQEQAEFEPREPFLG
ncbi:hypothetical protein ABTD92_21030, partial [Acinetobacter baumannii]